MKHIKGKPAIVRPNRQLTPFCPDIPLAREIVKAFGYSDYAFYDRYNLERIIQSQLHLRLKEHEEYNYFKEIRVLPDPKHMVGLKVGWGFNYCLDDPVIARNVTENVLEVPILKEFLARGCKIKFIGGSPNKFRKFHDNMEDHSYEWKKLPPQYNPTASWMEDCITNYEDRDEMKLPDVDFVIMNAFPSFPFPNMRFYLVCLHYAEKGIPVFLWDPELRTLKTKETDNVPKYFRYSGADKIFSKKQFRQIVDNSYWLLQIHHKSMDYIKKLNPRIRMISFFPPYDIMLADAGLLDIHREPKYRIMYIGNDSERRATFKRFFTPLSKKNKLHLWGGGMSRRVEGYKDNFDQYMGNTKLHGKIDQADVWLKYNLARTCLSIARQRYYDTGWIVHRFFEVILGRCILLVPREMYGVDRYFKKAFIVDDIAHLENRINFFNDTIKWERLEYAHDIQKKFVFDNFSSEHCVEKIFRVLGV